VSADSRAAAAMILRVVMLMFPYSQEMLMLRRWHLYC
jgi:hypothetical protein